MATDDTRGRWVVFGSQALETAVGLATMFLVLALAASSLVEFTGQLLKKRSNDLQKVLGRLLENQVPVGIWARIGALLTRPKDLIRPAEPPADPPTAELAPVELAPVDPDAPVPPAPPAPVVPADPPTGEAVTTITATQAYVAAAAASKRGHPSYLSATAFADAVAEVLDDGDGVLRSIESLPAGLRDRLVRLAKQPAATAEERVLAVRAGVEQWFDEAMAHLEGNYKRWSRWMLLVFGLVLAIGANASAFTVAERLWTDVPTREAVSNASSKAAKEGDPKGLATVASTTDELTQLHLPVGWDRQASKRWHDTSGSEIAPGVTRNRLGMVAGWLVTALLVSLGAPFWFDVLTRLASLRGAGPKPPVATDDPTSASTQLQQARASAVAAGSRSGQLHTTGQSEAETAIATAFGLISR